MVHFNQFVGAGPLRITSLQRKPLRTCFCIRRGRTLAIITPNCHSGQLLSRSSRMTRFWRAGTEVRIAPADTGLLALVSTVERLAE
jgi:hypothetical protein